MRTLITGIFGVILVMIAIATAAEHASPADDANAVAALDARYQAAVKANDAATMDRILADDFVHVTRAGAAIDYNLWFSDTYVRTPGGWRYAFGQASLALPKAP